MSLFRTVNITDDFAVHPLSGAGHLELVIEDTHASGIRVVAREPLTPDLVDRLIEVLEEARER